MVARDLDSGQVQYAHAISGGTSNGYYGAPIPAGSYAILAGKNDNFYRLERYDRNFGDDETPEGRTELRLHPAGTVSVGCITCEAGRGGDGIGGMLQGTRKSTASVNYKGHNPFNSSYWSGKEIVAKYGNITVRASGPYRYNDKTGVLSVVTAAAKGNTPEKTQPVCVLDRSGVCRQ